MASPSTTIDITPCPEDLRSWIVHVAKSDLPLAIELAAQLEGECRECVPSFAELHAAHVSYSVSEPSREWTIYRVSGNPGAPRAHFAGTVLAATEEGAQLAALRRGLVSDPNAIVAKESD